MLKKPILVLIIAGFLIYFNSLFNSFVWDDEEQVLNNSAVHSMTNLPLFFKSSTFNSGGTGEMGGLYYKPLMTTTFAFLYTLFGPNPFFFHFFQLILHIGNGILVFLLFKKLLQKETLSFFLALLFLIHPLNTEAVVYVSDLQDILYFFFGMLALLKITSTDFFHIKDLALISFLFLLSLLSKETGGLLVIISTLYVFFWKRKQMLFFLAAPAIAITIYSYLRFIVAGIYFNKHGLSPITKMDFFERLLSAPQIIFTYFKNFIFPIDLAINQHWVVTSPSFELFILPLLIGLFFFLLLMGMGITIFKKAKSIFSVYVFFLIWFIIALGFHLHIFPLDLTVSDRWFYLPMVGLLGLIGVIINKLKVKNEKFKIIGLGLLVIIFISFSIRTMVRNTDWKDGLTLYSHDVRISKDSFDLENNLGVELFRAGKLEEARSHFEKSTQIAPEWWTNWNNLGVIAERKKDYQKALEYYQKALDNGNYYLAYENLANLYLIMGDNEKTLNFTENSLKKLPQNPKLWFIFSVSSYKNGDKDKALQAAKNAYTLSPTPQNYYLYNKLIQNLPLEFKD